MKRFFALAALVLGLAACQTEPEGLDVNVGGAVDTTITVSLPETTRANSALGAFENVDLNDTNGTNYTVRYIFEVYYGNTGTQKQVYYTDGKNASFPVRLVPNRHYNFVTWADIVEQPADDKMNKALPYEDTDVYYETSDLTNITIIDSEWVAMDEKRDAFTGHFDTAVDDDKKPYNGAKSINITLTRPFAKLRVITTDMEQLNDLGIAPTKAAVTYATNHLYSSFNAFAGAVNNAKTTKTHDTFVIKDYNDNVTDKSKVLFTDYIFAADQDEVVNFTLTVYDQGDVVIGKETNFNTPIPARRNYLTTISGNILTDGNKIKVEVEDAFANAGSSTTAPYYQETISSVAELLAAIDANNGEYILISDLDVNGVTTSALAATRAAGNGTTINLNGYTITLKTNIEVKSGKTLTINNDPVDNAGNDKGAIVSVNDAAIVNNGTLIIEGGNFGENTIKNNGTANVSGGDFADGAIVNNGSVSVEGDNSGDEDRIIENGGTDAVVSNIVYTVAELQAALDEGKVDEIIFGADLVGEATISQREGVNVYINGAGKKFDGVLYIHGNARSTGAETVKIANINFESESAKYFIHANYQTEPQRYAHNVTIEGCTFTSLADDNSVAVCGASFRQAYNVTIKNCTANNTFYLAWFSGCYNVAIEGCEAYNNYEGITLGRGSTTSIKNSKINAELYGVRIESVSSGVETHNVTINNCELNAFIPVSVRSLTTGKFNLALQGVNKLTRGGLYDIALCSNEYKEGAVAKAPTCEWTISGADDFIVFPREYAVKSVEQIAEALTLKSKVLFAADIKGDVYIAQQKDFNVVIDGRGYQFDGTFTIDGMNRNNGAETLTLKNINFYTESTDEKTFISCPSTYNGVNERYSHNVTIDGCTFRAKSLTEKVGAISAQKTYHLAVKNCEAYNIHSLLQVQSCDNDVTVENVKVEDCFSGISVGNTKTTSISNADIKAQKYGIRLDGETTRKVTVNVANSNIEAYIPIVARKVITGCNVDVILSETTLVNNNNDMLDVVFQNNKDYEDGNVTPVAPTGNWNITGADDFIVFPRNYAGSQAELDAALKNRDIKNIVLGEGEFKADLYANDVARESLTITGTEGTQLAFLKGQVRAELFNNLTIKNCEILRMAEKSWGMLVFSTGKENGVYTVENCTFNGVNTQGIYINEMHKATYNIKNCTFNGDFTCNDGAITIQNNAGVKFAVNVADCKFENFLGTEIFVLYNNNDMTLNAEGIGVVNGNR